MSLHVVFFSYILCVFSIKILAVKSVYLLYAQKQKGKKIKENCLTYWQVAKMKKYLVTQPQICV